jgi:hypothetical protein
MIFSGKLQKICTCLNISDHIKCLIQPNLSTQNTQDKIRNKFSETFGLIDNPYAYKQRNIYCSFSVRILISSDIHLGYGEKLPERYLYIWYTFYSVLITSLSRSAFWV